MKLKNTCDLSNWEHFFPQNLREGLRPSLNLSGGGKCPPPLPCIRPWLRQFLGRALRLGDRALQLGSQALRLRQVRGSSAAAIERLGAWELRPHDQLYPCVWEEVQKSYIRKLTKNFLENFKLKKIE